MVYLYNSNYFNNIIISGLPGILSIFLSFISIPIFLNQLSTELYANFLIQHSILTLGMILNLNLGKLAAIKFQKLNLKLKKEVIFTSIVASIITGILLSAITFFIIHYFFNNKNFFEISISLFFGLLVTIIYISTEHIIKGLGYFKICSFSNFLFYSLSLSLPALLLLIDNQNFLLLNNLFNISLIIKFFSLFCLIVVLIRKDRLIFSNINFKLFDDFKIHSKWMTVYGVYNQIYDYIDKYLIKINLGSLMLITYSVPQQIAAKLTIFSQSIIAVLLPRLSKEKADLKKRNILSANLYFFIFIISLPLIITLPFYDEILNWWLKNSYTLTILKLFKIFILLTFLGCLSSIIITFYEATLSSRKNTKYETYTIFPFILGLIICVYFKNVFYFAILLFLKELILIFVRMFSIKDYITSFKYFIFYIIFFIFAFIFSIINQDFFSYLISFIFLTTLLMKFPYKLIIKEFFITGRFNFK